LEPFIGSVCLCVCVSVCTALLKKVVSATASDCKITNVGNAAV